MSDLNGLETYSVMDEGNPESKRLADDIVRRHSTFYSRDGIDASGPFEAINEYAKANHNSFSQAASVIALLERRIVDLESRLSAAGIAPTP